MEQSTRSICLPNLVLRKLYKGGLLRQRKGQSKKQAVNHAEGDRQKGRPRGLDARGTTPGHFPTLKGPLAVCSAYSIVGLVCILCYVNSLHGDFVHDDIMAITRNPDLKPEAPLSDLWMNDFWGTPIRQNNSHKSYRPLTVLSFRLNYAIGGLDTYGYHVVNVALHVLATWLLMLLSQLMLRMHLASVALAGLLFASHPIHTEAVCGVVGRAELLSACLFLASILSFLRSIHFDTTHNKRKTQVSPNWALFVLALFLSGAAMLAKEQGIMALPICLLLDVLLISRQYGVGFRSLRKVPPRSASRLCALILSTMVLVCIRFHIMGWSTPQFKTEDNPAAFSSQWITRAMTYSYIYAFNMVLLLCPSTLSYDWQMGSIPLLHQLPDIRNLASVSLFMSLLLITRYCLQNRKTTTSPSRLPAIVGLLLLVLPFLPAANIICPVGFVVAERVLYIPSMGFILLLVHTIDVCWSRMETGSKHRRALVLGCLLLSGTWTSRTVIRNEVWTSREALFRSGLEALPNNAKMHFNWANWLKDSGNKTEASQHYHKAIGLWPEYASAYNNLGTVTMDVKKAETFYTTAITLLPTHAGAYFNLGNLLSSTGRAAEAERALQKAVTLDPVFPDAHSSLAVLLEEQGQHTEAEVAYRTAISLRPHDPNLHNNLAVFLANKGNFHEALSHYNKALSNDSRHHITLLNAAKLHKQLENFREASKLFERALAVNQDIATLEESAVFFFNNNRSKKALGLFKKLLRREPNSIKYKLYYAQIISKEGRLQDAERIYNHVLAADAGNIDALYQLSKLYGLVKKHREAIELLTRATLLTTDDHSFLGVLHFELGNHHKDSGLMQLAFQHYSKSVKLNPSVADAHLNLGVFYHIKGEFHLAKTHYEEALRQSPENVLIQDNLEKLHKRLDVSIAASVT